MRSRSLVMPYLKPVQTTWAILSLQPVPVPQRELKALLAIVVPFPLAGGAAPVALTKLNVNPSSGNEVVTGLLGFESCIHS